MNNYKTIWNTILQDKRFREKSASIKSDARNPFENDYGRLISSAPIRRLQDKTQVFPLEESDYIRTRLTHSLEVSYIASSIGQSIEEFLISRGELNQEKRGWLSSLLKVAGLVHDLGNPPFGHFGETSIQNFFSDYFSQHEKTKEALTPQERADFEHFDGNVQTFRILTKLYYFKDEYGYNLTYSSLASVIKYPCDSLTGNKPKGKVAQKKFGYFTTEEDRYEQINSFLKFNHQRFPLTYILEAADDIAYSAADAEDGIKKGVITIDDVRDHFKNIQDPYTNGQTLAERLDQIYKECDHDAFNTIQQFRISNQREMIEGAIEAFEENYDDIMQGKFEQELLKASRASAIRDAYKKLFIKICNNRDILIKEIAGGEAIRGLLDIFVDAAARHIENPKQEDRFNAKNASNDAHLYQVLSETYRRVYNELDPDYSNDLCKRLHLIVDYISGMTDTYAIQLYQQLKGIRL